MTDSVYMSAHVYKPLAKYLKDNGFTLHTLDGSDSPVYREVSTHADIHMCQLGLWENSRIFPGNTKNLGNNYPGNIIYNAVCTGKYFIHNLKYTDTELLTYARQWQRENYPGTEFREIHVSQGYTRCCCLPVDNSSFITSDEGIARALKAAEANVLLIRKGYIELTGFDYGFIGGCAGHITVKGRRSIIFNGSLSAHPDCKKITAFIKDRDIDIISFNDYPLADIGSILCGSQAFNTAA